jgi:hypothetical protein
LSAAFGGHLGPIYTKNLKEKLSGWHARIISHSWWNHYFVVTMWWMGNIIMALPLSPGNLGEYTKWTTMWSLPLAVAARSLRVITPPFPGFLLFIFLYCGATIGGQSLIDTVNGRYAITDGWIPTI